MKLDVCGSMVFSNPVTIMQVQIEETFELIFHRGIAKYDILLTFYYYLLILWIAYCRHSNFGMLLAKHQSSLPQIYKIFDIHLPLLHHSPNVSPVNSLNSFIFYPTHVFYYMVYVNIRMYMVKMVYPLTFINEALRLSDSPLVASTASP